MSNERMTGTVKWFDNAKGYGFVVTPDRADCFIHYRSVEPESDGYKTLRGGEEVEFLRVHSEKGYTAVEAKKAA